MKHLIALLLLLGSVSAFALENGKPAPDFFGKLKQYQGKTIVLEWLNHGCPFVRKHYDSGNMSALQKEFTGKDVVWLSIISSAKGTQGWVTKEDAAKEKAKYKSIATEIILDEEGVVGRMYEAKTTPHMYIINKNGILVYQGAIDSIADTNQDSIKKAEPWFRDALSETLEGKKVKRSTTKAYGCAVKYKD